MKSIKVSKSFFNTCLLGISSSVMIPRSPLPRGKNIIICDTTGREATAEVLKSQKVVVESIEPISQVYNIKISGIHVDMYWGFQLFGFQSLYEFAKFIEASKTISVVKFHNFHIVSVLKPKPSM